MPETGAGAPTLAPVAFLGLAGATAQFMTLAAPPLSPTHRTGVHRGFGDRLSDDLCASFIIRVISRFCDIVNLPTEQKSDIDYMWRLLQYRRVVEALLDSQPADLESVETRLDILADRGNLCRRPISAWIEDGICELRGTGTTRLLFYYRRNREIVFVHVVTKKRAKLDRGDIELAKTIRSQIEENGEEGNISPVADQD